MVPDDLLDVDASGMVGKDKGNPIAAAGGKRGVRTEVREMGQKGLKALSAFCRDRSFLDTLIHFSFTPNNPLHSPMALYPATTK
eukprot:g16343.t1